MENIISSNLLSISPILIISVGILLILILEVIYKQKDKLIPLFMGLGSVFLSIGMVYILLDFAETKAVFFGGSIKITYFGIAIAIICLLGTALVMLLSHAYIIKTHSNYGEYYALIMLSATGMLTIAFCNDLFTFLIGFELMSIAVYILSGINRYSLKSNEAGMKYFILGAFSTGFMIFGMSFLYGSTGEVVFSEIAQKINEAFTAVSSQEGKLIEVHFYLSLVGLGLMLIGFLFKIGAVPFHSWIPDVYEGSPTNVTAFMSTAIKAAGMAVIVRILFECIPSLTSIWINIFIVIALITVVAGNLLALVQTNIKRLLAYSSIAHSGYILSGIVAMGVISLTNTGADKSNEAISGILFYLLAYLLMNIGAFACLIAFSTYERRELETLEDIKGIGHRYKLLGLCFTIFFLSLGGIPLTAGFMGKLLIFKSIFVSAANGSEWQFSLYALGIVGILTSILSLFYYIRVIAYSYFKNPVSQEIGASYWNFTFVAFIAMILTILFGLLPQIGFIVLGGYFNLTLF